MLMSCVLLWWLIRWVGGWLSNPPPPRWGWDKSGSVGFPKIWVGGSRNSRLLPVDRRIPAPHLRSPPLARLHRRSPPCPTSGSSLSAGTPPSKARSRCGGTRGPGSRWWSPCTSSRSIGRTPCSRSAGVAALSRERTAQGTRLRAPHISPAVIGLDLIPAVKTMVRGHGSDRGLPRQKAL